MSEYKRELAAFVVTITKKLERNIHKTSWKNDSVYHLLSLLNGEVKELTEELEKVHRGGCRLDFGLEAVMDECADVAAYAMMIHDLAAILLNETNRGIHYSNHVGFRPAQGMLKKLEGAEEKKYDELCANHKKMLRRFLGLDVAQEKKEGE